MTPMLSLLLIWAVIYIVNNTEIITSSSPDISLDPSGIIPSYIYIGYAANKNNGMGFFDHWNAYRILKYSAPPALKDTIKNMLERRITLVDYEQNGTKYPRFNESDYRTEDGQNQVLIKDLQTGWKVPRDKMERHQGIGDAYMLYNDSDFNGCGTNIHMQVNNIASNFLHRTNGISKIRFRFNMTSNKTTSFIVGTEAYIGTMNYLNNKYLLERTAGPIELFVIPKILSIISLTIDSSAIFGFVEAGLATLSIIFFPVALTMGFPLLLYSLVLESEEKILNLLNTNGLLTGNYWASIYLFYYTLFTVTTTIFSLIGWNFLDTVFFRDIPKLLLTLFFAGWNLSQISFGIFLSTVIKSSVYANLIGYLLSVLLSFALSGISLSVFPNPSTMPWYFYLVPHSAYIRFFYSVTFDCVSQKCPTGVFDLKGDTRRSFYALFLVTLLYTGLAAALVIFNWGDAISNFFTSSGTKQTQVTGEGDYQLPADVSIGKISYGTIQDGGIEKAPLLEEEFADPSFTIVSQKLTKVYPNGTKALTDFSIKIKKDKVFGLLGPNGAGKTTFLSILTGSLQKTSGRVFLEGQEVRFGERRDALIGFCPQFDVLWPSLTVEEHVIFFTKFKRFTPPSMDAYLRETIGSVGLLDDCKKKATELSGGMRRRVSLACAVTGDPKVIFLDEPSSGLDPVRRREFWELIKKVGVGRAVVLTTHLMEEADVLSDEIGIMYGGELKAVDTPQALKDKYCSGLKMQIVLTEIEKKQQVIDHMMTSFKSCSVDWEFDKTITLTVEDSTHKMLKVFEAARRLTDQGLISDWSMMQGSLEEVFLSVVRDGRREGASR